VYGASWEGAPVKLFQARPGTPESRPLDVGDAELLDLSPQGEMAVLMAGGEKPYYSPNRRNRVLARVSLGGGTPREVMHDVIWAAWSPDGKSLAVVRDMEGKQRLEYPAGTVRYETSGWITHPRVSPDGASVAFLDHPVRGDDRGDVALVDTKGNKQVLASGYTSVLGLAFASKDEVYYAGALGGMTRALCATRIGSKRTRTIAKMFGQLILHDVSSDGRVLVTHDAYQASLNVLVPGAAREVDLAWLDSSGINDVSPDGRTILFTEQGDGGGPHYSVYLRKVDGPAIRLGDGQGLSLAPDQKSALAVLYEGPDLVVLPTGVGEPRTLPRGTIREIHWADFTPDGKRVLFLGNQASAGPRLFSQSLSGGDPQPIAPEGVTTSGHPFTPDGARLAVRSPDGTLVLMPASGGEPTPIAGAEPGDVPVRFSSDGRALFVSRGLDIPLTLYRVDIAAKRREPWRTLLPADLAGVQAVGPVRLTEDGKGYAYNSAQFLSSLYVLSGLH
jgi:Tol biopolymer transport system component